MTAAIECPDVSCDRKAGHPGAHLKRCTSAGCTDVLGHRGRHTSGLYGYQAQGWAAPSVQTGEQP